MDLIVTYNYTPALNEELNPLVSLGNLDWFGFIVFQLILSLLIVALWSFFIWGKKWEISKPDLKYTDYIYYYFFDKLEPWSKRFFTLPKHIYPHFRLLAFVTTITSIIISIFAIFHNMLLINGNQTYQAFVLDTITPYFSIVILSAIFISANLFFVYEFKDYKRTKQV